MGGSLFGLKLDGRAMRTSIIFLSACLVMTGHFISSFASVPADDITVVRGGADGQQPPDAGHGDGGGGQQAEVAERGAGGAESGVDGSSGDDSSGDGINGGGGNGTVGGSNDTEGGGEDASGGGFGGGGDAADGSLQGSLGVRDGYSVPGGIGSGGGGATDAISDDDMIYVYVTGAVQRPGVYAIARSSMVIDIVELAGGFTEQADAENVNMVYRLESNAMLNIKKKPATVANVGAGGDAGGSAVAAQVSADESVNPYSSELYGGAVEITYGYDGILSTGDNASEGAGGAGSRRININTASADELATLPGIGKATAESIIAHRSVYRFNRIEDLMQVNGIKQAKFDAVKDLISC